MKEICRAAARTFLGALTVIISVNILAAGLLVATLQSRNDLYLPLAGANPREDAAEVMAGEQPLFADCREVSIESADGLTLRGRLWIRDGMHRWVVLVHGYSNSSDDMLSLGRTLWNSGYNLLLPDLRAHGASDGKTVGMGWKDRDDLIRWTELIKDGDPEARIALMGVSMGASAALMTAAECGSVCAVVSDCAYSELGALMEYHLRCDLGLPSFPVAWFGDVISKSAAGYGWYEVSALEQVKKSAVPTLFIHGGDDVFVPVDMAYELYGAAAGPKELLIMEGAGHALSRYTDTVLYDETVLDFLGRYVR